MYLLHPTFLGPFAQSGPYSLSRAKRGRSCLTCTTSAKESQICDSLTLLSRFKIVPRSLKHRKIRRTALYCQIAKRITKPTRGSPNRQPGNTSNSQHDPTYRIELKSARSWRSTAVLVQPIGHSETTIRIEYERPRCLSASGVHSNHSDPQVPNAAAEFHAPKTDLSRT
jgi:hypothetical protein